MVEIRLSAESLAFLRQLSADMDQPVDEMARIMLESALVMADSRE